MLHSFRSSFVLGFHGCDAAVAGAILSGRLQHLSASENKYDWLGSGVYFWEGSPARARDWALERMKRFTKSRRAAKPGVVGAVIDLGNCLDLLDTRYFGLVRDAYLGLEQTTKVSGVPMPENRSIRGEPDRLLRDLDCSVINMLHETRRTANLPPFDTVRAAFFEGRPLYKGAGFHDKNHIQICVRNPACVKGYFRPLWASDESR